MPVKIKVRPEDFVVEEISALPLDKKGEFAAYLLEKQGWNTVELLLELSRVLKVPFKCFGYGGRKDRHGLTRQYISIKGKKAPDLKNEKYALKFVGYMQRPMGPDLIRENKFDITARNLNVDSKDDYLLQIESVNSFGYPNYFDDQRFGSFEARQGFLAEKILRRQFNGALKIYLTGIYAGDKKEERLRKKFFFEHWKDWQACLRAAKTKSERMSFDLLVHKPNAFLEALKMMPRYELSAFISAYQGFLWNEILRKVIKLKISGPLKTYAGLAGNYIFYERMNGSDYRYLSKLDLPVPGAGFKAEDALVKELYAQVLADNQLRSPMFNRMKLRQAFFKSFGRRTIVKPQGLVFNFSEDDLFPGRKKLRLKFSLPAGSYATMFVKRIFSVSCGCA